MGFPHMEFKCTWFSKINWWKTVFWTSPWDPPVLSLPQPPKSKASFYIELPELQYISFLRLMCYKLGALKQQKFFSHNSGGKKPKTKVSTGPCSLWRCQQRSGLPCLFQLLVAAISPQCPLAQRRITAGPACIFTQPAAPWLSSSRKDTSLMD